MAAAGEQAKDQAEDQARDQATDRTWVAERAAPLIAWLTEQGLQGTSRRDMLAGFCGHLRDCGLPLWRFHLAQRAFHPQFGGIGFNWKHGTGLSSEHYEYRETPREAWLRSPFFHILEQNLDEFQSMLAGQDLDRFPLLTELKELGATHYYAAGLRFTGPDSPPIDPASPGEGVLASWTTDQPGGFSGRELALLRVLIPHMGLALKSTSNQHMAKDLLQVYLGRDAGKRVLSGEIRRGSSRKIDAVICLFDLKGFTSMAERLPGAEMVDMLNDYFAIAVKEVQSHGGNVLKFMGDGMLAIFNLGDLETDARTALEAVRSLCARLASRNAERTAAGMPVLEFTVALHAGDILYGNIGAENRLDFTVIGPAVNQTARISGMHGPVGQAIILSQDVQRAVRGRDAGLVSLGRYMLRGVSEPIELFTIHDPAPEA